MGDNPFAKLAGKMVGDGTSTIKLPPLEYTNESIAEWIQNSQAPKKSSICALFVGHPKSCKTGTALDCRTDADKKAHKKVIAIELNSDQGCDVCRKEHHADDPDIIVLNPREYTKDTKGEWQPDYIKTMAKIKATLQYLKDEQDNLNMKAIIFDGLDIFLSELCEAQMRVDEHLDISGGVSQRFWKKRNEYYFKILNMLFDIDVDKYLITHYGARRRSEKTGDWDDDRQTSKLDPSFVYSCQKTTPDKMHQIVEFQDKTRVERGVKKIEITATIISDRRNLEAHMEELIIAKSDENGKVKWTGQGILEEK